MKQGFILLLNAIRLFCFQDVHQQNLGDVIDLSPYYNPYPYLVHEVRVNSFLKT